MISVVNVVGAGDLGMEHNFSSLSDDIDAYEVNYDEENYPELYDRLSEEEPMVTLYQTGSYHISGAGSEDGFLEPRELLFERLDELGLDLSTTDWFSVRNVVCVGNSEQSLNLNAIVIRFDLKKVEYVPEQSPRLVYHPDSFDLVFLLFSSGKAVITGSPGAAVSREAFKSLQE